MDEPICDSTGERRAWTPEEERYLSQHWDASDKGRVRKIAEELNRPRSSVIGKAYRMLRRFF